MKKVIIESPYAGDNKRNVEYGRRCLKDSLEKEEAPFASHLFYPQVLDDMNITERELGIRCGLSWSEDADAVAFYVDYGMSKGMEEALSHHNARQTKIEIRTIGRNDAKH